MCIKKFLILLLSLFFSSNLIFAQSADIIKLKYTSDIPQYMKDPYYWISKLEEPNKIILTKEQIQHFNRKLFYLDVGLIRIDKYKSTMPVEKLNKRIRNRLKWFDNKEYIDINLKKVPRKFFNDIAKNINKKYKSKYKEISYAIVVKRTDVRILPTAKSIFLNKNSLDIDRLQEEAIDVGTPVVVLCTTVDKKWTYVIATNEDGWVKTKDLAFTYKSNIIKWINYKNKIVVTSLKTHIYSDAMMKTKIVSPRMGSTLPLVKEFKNKVLVKYPTRNKYKNLVIKQGYIDKKDINIGYLPYTQKNVLIQAFKHIDTYYGWGGVHGKRDCSGLLTQVFNCFGFILPETSFHKSNIGKVNVFNNNDSNEYKEQSIITKATPGISFIYLPGHIVMYIGSDNNVPYILHSIWGITTPDEQQEQKALMYINKTIVSTLKLGENVNNSLLKRTTKFTTIK